VPRPRMVVVSKPPRELTLPTPAPTEYSTIALDVDDVDKAFRQLLETAMARRPSQSKRWAVELSGGMDSTCGAAGVARSAMPGSLLTADSWPPPSRIPSTSLLAHACRSPCLARWGLWRGALALA
jgi:hypothetical protein